MIEGGILDELFSFENLYDSAIECSKNVSWKSSVAHYILNINDETYKLYNELHNGTYKERKHKIFTIYEPKKREVMSIQFRDRVVQKVLCEKVILPIMSRSFILDNCASQKDKGTDFARNRLKRYMRDYFQRNKSNEGYIIQIDIKKYYPSMDHETAKELFRKKLPQEVYEFAEKILDAQGGEVGYYPGSQIIQILGMAVLDGVDHYIKERLKVKEYVRYMDDLILIVKDNPQFYIDEIEKEINKLKLNINKEKTKYSKISEGDVFLGFKFSVSKTGKVYMILINKNIKRRKKKLRTVKYGSEKELENSYQTWKSYAIRGDNKKRVKMVDNIFEERRKTYEIPSEN